MNNYLQYNDKQLTVLPLANSTTSAFSLLSNNTDASLSHKEKNISNNDDDAVAASEIVISQLLNLDLDLKNDTYLDDFLKIEENSNLILDAETDSNNIDPTRKLPLETATKLLSTPGIGFGVVELSSDDDDDVDNKSNYLSIRKKSSSFDNETNFLSFSESIPSLRDIETGNILLNSIIITPSKIKLIL